MSGGRRPIDLMAALLAAAALTTLARAVAAEPFSFLPPGDLIAGSGEGRVDDTVYAPGIRFPIEEAPSYANSQVYGDGGMYGPGGSQCDSINYSYPWRDNYCEKRSWDMPLCPAGTGHQGQDIRPPSCDKDTYWAVATTDGTITYIGSYSVHLTAADGTRFDFLHMSTVQVNEGDSVTRGQHLGLVSNQFGGTSTTIHLHFNIRQNVEGVGDVYVPPYTSLIGAYAVLIDAPPNGELEAVDCDAIVGWAYDPDDAAAASDVVLSFSASSVSEGDHLSTADLSRQDLCAQLGSCEHGLWQPSPLSLFDGTEHQVAAGVDYATLGTTEALEGSPLPLSCPTPAVEGVRRPIDATRFEAWALSTFWDQPPIAAATVEALDRGEAWPASPEVVTGGGAQANYWVVDGGHRRAIADELVARAWRLDLGAAEALSTAQLAAIDEGPDLPARPLLLRDADDALYLLDAAPAGSSPVPTSPTEATGITGGNADCACRVVGGHPRSPRTPWWCASLLLGAGLARRTQSTARRRPRRRRPRRRRR